MKMSLLTSSHLRRIRLQSPSWYVLISFDQWTSFFNFEFHVVAAHGSFTTVAWNRILSLWRDGILWQFFTPTGAVWKLCHRLEILAICNGFFTSLRLLFSLGKGWWITVSLSTFKTCRSDANVFCSYQNLWSIAKGTCTWRRIKFWM